MCHRDPPADNGFHPVTNNLLEYVANQGTLAMPRLYGPVFMTDEPVRGQGRDGNQPASMKYRGMMFGYKGGGIHENAGFWATLLPDRMTVPPWD